MVLPLDQAHKRRALCEHSIKSLEDIICWELSLAVFFALAELLQRGPHLLIEGEGEHTKGPLREGGREMGLVQPKNPHCGTMT